MANNNFKPLNHKLGQEGKGDSSTKTFSNQAQADLFEKLVAKSSATNGDKGIEGVSSGLADDSQKIKPQSNLSPEDQVKLQQKKRKEVELEARLQQIIARYRKIQEEIRAYQKKKKQEEEKKKKLEEREKEKKRKEEEKKKQQKVALPASPKKGFMAGFLKKLSSGGEQGRLKE